MRTSQLSNTLRLLTACWLWQPHCPPSHPHRSIIFKGHQIGLKGLSEVFLCDHSTKTRDQKYATLIFSMAKERELADTGVDGPLASHASSTEMIKPPSITQWQSNKLIGCVNRPKRDPKQATLLSLPASFINHKVEFLVDSGAERSVTVSYTHLTLPTIYSV